MKVKIDYGTSPDISGNGEALVDLPFLPRIGEHIDLYSVVKDPQIQEKCTYYWEVKIIRWEMIDGEFIPELIVNEFEY